MKKILILAVFCMLTICLLAGCAENTSETQTQEQEVVITDNAGGTDLPSLDNYEDTFLDLVTYLTEAGIIKGEGTDLTASAIGAKQGKRFAMTVGPTKYYIEVFEYTDQTSDKARSVIENARNDHSFSLFDVTESATQNTYAVVSDNGKYLLLYTDTSTGDGAAQRQKNAESAMMNFCSNI